MVDEEQGEISLLDLLLVVAENLRLLVLGPLLVALLAWGVAWTLPKSYLSQAIIALPGTAPNAPPALSANQAASMLQSPLVLDAVVSQLRLFPDLEAQAARKRLAEQIKPTVGKDGLLRLEVSGQQPEQAMSITNTLIDAWLKSTVPGPSESRDLQKRLGYAEKSLEAVSHAIAALASDSGRLSKPMGGDGTTLAALGDLRARFLNESMDISRTLQGLNRDVVKQPPTLPTEAESPKKALIAVVSGLATGFLLLLWVFVRQAWRAGQTDPVLAEKHARLRRSLGLK
jgi:Chain length determinant protein